MTPLKRARDNFGDCIFGHIFLMEISTPFVSARGILSAFDLKKSLFYVVNGVLMMLTFAIFRVLMWPYLFYRFSIEAKISVLQVNQFFLLNK